MLNHIIYLSDLSHWYVEFMISLLKLTLGFLFYIMLQRSFLHPHLSLNGRLVIVEAVIWLIFPCTVVKVIYSDFFPLCMCSDYINRQIDAVYTFKNRLFPCSLSFLRNISQLTVSDNTRIYTKSGPKHAFRYSGFSGFRLNVFKMTTKI